jgi:hypothetical protein
MRLSGRICYSCKIPLSTPEKPGERLCDRCQQAKAPRRRVYMSFMLRDDCFCQFLEEDCKTSLPRKLTFKDPAKLIELTERAGAMNLEDRQSLEHAIETGRGGIWLELTEEQYMRLKH